MSVGGPAFPVPEVLLQSAQVKAADAAGMTLRDYFAAKALAALISKPTPAGVVGSTPLDKVADAAYAYADAMIRSRGKP